MHQVTSLYITLDSSVYLCAPVGTTAYCHTTLYHMPSHMRQRIHHFTTLLVSPPWCQLHLPICSERPERPDSSHDNGNDTIVPILNSFGVQYTNERALSPCNALFGGLPMPPPPTNSYQSRLITLWLHAQSICQDNSWNLSAPLLNYLVTSVF